MLQQQLSMEHPTDPVSLPANAVGRIERGRIDVRFAAHPKRVEQMRNITCLQLRNCGHHNGDAVYMVGVVVSELVTNAVQHGANGTVTFSLVCEESGEIRIEVDDHSDGRPEAQPLDDNAENGRGLVIVEALTEAWGRDGSCTWCTFAASSEVAA